MRVGTSKNISSIRLNKKVEVSLVRKKLFYAFGSKLSGVQPWTLTFQQFSLSALSSGTDQPWLLIALAGAFSGISNLQDFLRHELLCCCDILFSELVFVRSITLLTGRTGTAVDICCAVCWWLRKVRNWELAVWFSIYISCKKKKVQQLVFFMLSTSNCP